MTVIVAYKDYNNNVHIAADGRTTSGTLIVRDNAIKIHRCKHFVIGISGDAALNTDVSNGLLQLDDIKATYKDLKTKLYPRINKHVMSNREKQSVTNDGVKHSDTCMIVCTKTKIRDIDRFGDVSETEYGAIGNGAEYAEGYLTGVNYQRSFNDQDRVCAIESAKQNLNNIGGEYKHIVV